MARTRRKASRSPENPSKLQRFRESAARLWQNKSYADVEFIGEDGSISAHRAIVSVASPVLAAMLASNMLEGATAKIQVRFNIKTLEEGLKYLYLWDLPDLDSNAEYLNLMHIGDYFGVTGLRDECAVVLADRIKSGRDRTELLQTARNLGRLVRCCAPKAMHMKAIISDPGQRYVAFQDMARKLDVPANHGQVHVMQGMEGYVVGQALHIKDPNKIVAVFQIARSGEKILIGKSGLRIIQDRSDLLDAWLSLKDTLRSQPLLFDQILDAL